MKIKNYKKKNHKTVGILLFTLACVFLIVGVILYQTYAIYEVIKDKDLVNGEVEDPGDIYFAFYVDGILQKEMPKKESGYTLDEENSTCGVMGKIDRNIKPKLDRDTWSIVVEGVSTSRTKCNLEFKKTYDDQKIYDLSGNHYDGIFIGGAKVQKDNEGNLGIYFDGQNDYVDVADLPDTINWADGFTIETKFNSKSLSGWTRIVDFGVGEGNNNILFAVGTQEQNVHGFECSARYDATITSFIGVNNILNENETYKFKVTFDKLTNGFTGRVIMNDELLYSKVIENTNITKNITRTSNYIGKSNWVTEDLYKGYIYSLKITDANGKNILWYDF